MSYALIQNFGIAFLADSAENADEHLHLKAKVYSGDYFDDLAAKLEAIQGTLSPIIVDDLDVIIRDLLYLQQKYEITKK